MMGAKRCCYVHKCCGFVDLEKASILIGTFTLVTACIGVATLSRNLAVEQDQMATQILSKAASIDTHRLQAAIAYVRWGSIGLLLVGIACLFSSVGLIWAIKRKVVLYVVPWIVSHVVYTMYNILITLIAAVKLFSWNVPYHQLYIGCMLFWDLGMVVLLYFVAVVKSYYYQVKRQQKRRESSITATNSGIPRSQFQQHQQNYTSPSRRLSSNCAPGRQNSASNNLTAGSEYQLPPDQFSTDNSVALSGLGSRGNDDGAEVLGTPSVEGGCANVPTEAVQGAVTGNRDTSSFRFYCPPSAPPYSAVATNNPAVIETSAADQPPPPPYSTAIASSVSPPISPLSDRYSHLLDSPTSLPPPPLVNNASRHSSCSNLNSVYPGSGRHASFGGSCSASHHGYSRSMSTTATLPRHGTENHFLTGIGRTRKPSLSNLGFDPNNNHNGMLGGNNGSEYYRNPCDRSRSTLNRNSRAGTGFGLSCTCYPHTSLIPGFGVHNRNGSGCGVRFPAPKRHTNISMHGHSMGHTQKYGPCEDYNHHHHGNSHFRYYKYP